MWKTRTSPFEIMVIVAALACAAIIIWAVIAGEIDDRECKRYGAPIYIKSGDIMVPMEQCAEYYEEDEAHKQ